MTLDDEIKLLFDNKYFTEKYQENFKYIKYCHLSYIEKVYFTLKFAKNDFAFFVKIFYPFATTNNQQIDFHEGIRIETELLQLHSEGKLDKSIPIILNTCPGHGKSTVMDILYSAYLLLRNKKEEIMSFTLAAETKKANYLLFSNVVTSHLYKMIMNYEIEKNSEQTFLIKDGGGKKALTLQQITIGTNASVIIVDDPTDPFKSLHSAETTRINEGIFSVLMGRKRNDREEAKPLLIIQQRVSVTDATAYVIQELNKKQSKYIHIVLKHQEEEDVTFKIPLADGSTYTIKRNKGILWNNQEKLKQAKAQNQVVYLAQYQQEPSYALEELIFSRDSIKVIQAEPSELLYQGNFIVCDLSRDNSSKYDNDYTVMCYFEIYNNSLYLKDMYRQKLPRDISRTELMIEFYKKHNEAPLYIEYVTQNYTEIVDLQKNNVNLQGMKRVGHESIFAGSKFLRFSKASPILSQRLCFVKQEYYETIIQELSAITPKTVDLVHDDIMDCISDASIICKYYYSKN